MIAIMMVSQFSVRVTMNRFLRGRKFFPMDLVSGIGSL